MKKRVIKKIALTKETLGTLSNSAIRMVAGDGLLTGGDNGSCNASCATNESCRSCACGTYTACVSACYSC
jgi:hypothetical protein